MFTLLGLSALSAQQPPNQSDVLDQITASVMNGASAEILSQLTDDVGARLVGSPAYDQAAQWAVARFREAGVASVGLEEFTLPNGWQRGPARARLTAPISRTLRVGSVGWAPSTPPGGVRGDLILVSDLAAPALRAQSAQLKNRIVLVDLERALPADEPLAFARLRDSFALFRDLGVQAVLLPHDVPNNVSGWVDTGNARGTVLPLPVADIGWEDHLLVRRHLSRGLVTFEAEWQNDVTGPRQVSNVVGEITGSQLPHEWVLLGAHLDSWTWRPARKTTARGWSWCSRRHARLRRSAGRPGVRFGLPSGPPRSLDHRVHRCTSSATPASFATASPL